MLYLISLGLHDEKDMSLRALEAARKCDKLYAEFYTLRMHTDTGKLAELIGKPVQEIERAGLEEKAGAIIEEAKSSAVGVLVGGDALSATTHISILMEARKAGLSPRIVHGSSIFTAVAETGLQVYKFGRTVTLTLSGSMSAYDGVLRNREMGLHSLILLDIPMDIKGALDILLEMEKKGGKGLFAEDSMLVAACELGGRQTIRYRKIKELLQDKELEKRPAVLIVPGELHFLEKEYLESLS